MKSLTVRQKKLNMVSPVVHLKNDIKTSRDNRELMEDKVMPSKRSSPLLNIYTSAITINKCRIRKTTPAVRSKIRLTINAAVIIETTEEWIPLRNPVIVAGTGIKNTTKKSIGINEGIRSKSTLATPHNTPSKKDDKFKSKHLKLFSTVPYIL